MLVELRDATFGYGRRPVVHAAHVAVAPGDCLGVYGPNGSGKTTLVRGLTGLLRPMSGEVVRRRDLRCGYLPQRRDLDRHWPMSGFDAAAMAVSSRLPLGWVRRDAAAGVKTWMGKLAVAGLAKTRFSTLSGGQQQRLMLAGALAAGSELLVLDEPADGLDAASRQSFLDAVRDCLHDGLAAVLVSHDVDDLAALCTRVARLHPSADGTGPSEVECATPADLWRPAELAAAAGRAG
jgi:ABC-type Mn2+/Zn2+ transport system ATPase subunit